MSHYDLDRKLSSAIKEYLIIFESNKAIHWMPIPSVREWIRDIEILEEKVIEERTARAEWYCESKKLQNNLDQMHKLYHDETQKNLVKILFLENELNMLKNYACIKSSPKAFISNPTSSKLVSMQIKCDHCGKSFLTNEVEMLDEYEDLVTKEHVMFYKCNHCNKEVSFVKVKEN